MALFGVRVPRAFLAVPTSEVNVLILLLQKNLGKSMSCRKACFQGVDYGTKCHDSRRVSSICPQVYIGYRE